MRDRDSIAPAQAGAHDTPFSDGGAHDGAQLAVYDSELARFAALGREVRRALAHSAGCPWAKCRRCDADADAARALARQHPPVVVDVSRALVLAAPTCSDFVHARMVTSGGARREADS
jgi:hypothetical protein